MPSMPKPIRRWTRFYDDLAAVYRAEISDLADAGCRYLQIDEVNLAYLCDAELRRQVANIGEDPESLPKTYAKLINAAIAGKPADMTVCMHLCRGNFAGAWIADGGYEPIAELLFNEIGVDGYFLEYDSDRGGRLCAAALSAERQNRRARSRSPPKARRWRPKTTSSGASRRPAATRRSNNSRSRRNAAFPSGIGGQTMTVDGEIAKLRLVVETAREVWGTA